jgi:hypothetical protein
MFLQWILVFCILSRGSGSDLTSAPVMTLSSMTLHKTKRKKNLHQEK